MRQSKIRPLNGNQEKTSFGITIPKDIAEKHLDTYYKVFEQDDCLLLVSGTKVIKGVDRGGIR